MKFSFYSIIRIFIALVWLVNGMYAKLLGMVPRHEKIVAEILQIQNAGTFVVIIGILETLMAVWILSGKYPKLNAVIQVIVVLTMNTLEFVFAPELLLWGKMNFVFAVLFAGLILWNEFYSPRHCSDYKPS